MHDPSVAPTSPGDGGVARRRPGPGTAEDRRPAEWRTRIGGARAAGSRNTPARIPPGHRPGGPAAANTVVSSSTIPGARAQPRADTRRRTRTWRAVAPPAPAVGLCLAAPGHGWVGGGRALGPDLTRGLHGRPACPLGGGSASPTGRLPPAALQFGEFALRRLPLLGEATPAPPLEGTGPGEAGAQRGHPRLRHPDRGRK